MAKKKITKKTMKKTKTKAAKKSKTLAKLSVVELQNSAPKLRFSKSVARQIAAIMTKSMNDDDFDIRL